MQIDHAPAADDHRVGCARFLYEQDLPNCKGEEGRDIGGTQQVAQASSRTGGYDLYPGGGSPGGIPSPGEIYQNEYSGGTYQGGEYPGGAAPAGSDPGGSYPGGSQPAGNGPPEA
jgi:hypothetical protein